MGLLLNRTSFQEPHLAQCQVSICQALWGYGIPDLSGVGVSKYAREYLVSRSDQLSGRRRLLLGRQLRAITLSLIPRLIGL